MMKRSGSALRLFGAGCLVTLLSCDFFSDPVTPPDVASVRVTPGSVYLQLGTSAQLTAVTLDAAGNELFGREVSWTSSDPAIASVGAAGAVTGVAEGGPVTVTASSGGKSGTSEVRVAFTVLTGIRDIQTFLEKCPATDPAYPELREDFHLRVDGDPVLDPIPCSEPYSAMPVEELSNGLIATQAFRAAYHMSVASRLGPSVARAFRRDLARGLFMVEWGRGADLARAVELDELYGDLRLGLVEGVVMAVAERLEARAIATTDLRDFAPVELVGRPQLWPRDL